MKIIPRYLLKSFFGPLVLCLLCFNALYIIFDLFGQVSKFIDAKVGVATVLKYYGGMMSMYSYWFTPASCLLATLYTMWQLSRHSELTALRASGISFTGLTIPFLAVALCASAVTFFNSEMIAPAASVWSEQFKSDTLTGAGNSRLKENKNYHDPVTSDDWTFALADLSTERTMSKPVGRVVVKNGGADGSPIRMLRTERAEFLDGVWWFWNPQEFFYTIDEMGGGAPEDEPAPGADATQRPGIFPTPMPELVTTPRDIVLEQRDWEYLSAADMRRLISLRGANAAEPAKRCEYWSQITAPWACIVITFFAIPAGISTGRQSMIKGVILAFASFFGFYALTLAMQFFGSRGFIPPIFAALSPFIIFTAIGAVSYKRLV